MPYKITTECNGCGACEPRCPVDAISEGEIYYVIDPGLCNDCRGYYNSPICKRYCPIPGAIVRIPDSS